MAETEPTGLVGGWYPPHQPNCVGCGDQNPLGLRLRMRPSDDGVTGEVIFRTEHEGAPGFAHGGMVATALDDAFGMMLFRLRRPAVTARLEVDYRRPAFIDTPYGVHAKCESTEGRKLWLEARLTDDGAVVASARGLFLEVDESHFLKGVDRDEGGAGGDELRLPW